MGFSSHRSFIALNALAADCWRTCNVHTPLRINICTYKIVFYALTYSNMYVCVNDV